MTILSALKRAVSPVPRRTIQQIVETGAEKALERVLPSLVESCLASSFRRNPHKQLTKVGFMWALALYFENSWPDMGRANAISCARDCLEVPHGTPGYDWSAASAKEMVEEYVAAYGEAA